jgi:hypothetical protein
MTETQKAQREIEEMFQLRREAIQILELVVSEWQSDPMSVQCFDLRIVERAGQVIARLEQLDLLADKVSPEELAKRFHETYERLAPAFGYQTKKASAVPWDSVPSKNKALMIAVCQSILGELLKP